MDEAVGKMKQNVIEVAASIGLDDVINQEVFKGEEPKTCETSETIVVEGETGKKKKVFTPPTYYSQDAVPSSVKNIWLTSYLKIWQVTSIPCEKLPPVSCSDKCQFDASFEENGNMVISYFGKPEVVFSKNVIIIDEVAEYIESLRARAIQPSPEFGSDGEVKAERPAYLKFGKDHYIDDVQQNTITDDPVINELFSNINEHYDLTDPRVAFNHLEVQWFGMKTKEKEKDDNFSNSSLCIFTLGHARGLKYSSGGGGYFRVMVPPSHSVMFSPNHHKYSVTTQVDTTPMNSTIDSECIRLRFCNINPERYNPVEKKTSRKK